jgi:hypothetical protein
VLHPSVTLSLMDALSPPEFADVVRQLMVATAAAGMRMPSFRSPPREPSAQRTIRWVGDEKAIVAVRRGSRGADAVVADMIQGVVAANRLSGSAAEEATRKLAACLTRFSPPTDGESSISSAA